MRGSEQRPSRRAEERSRTRLATGVAWGGLIDLDLDALCDFDPDELIEFLEADGFDLQADPVFKERLRLELWWLVATRAAERRRDLV